MDGGEGRLITATDAFKAVMTGEVATLYARFDLLDKSENFLETYTAPIKDGSISVDKTGDNAPRRQFSVTLDNSDGTFTWSVGGRIWLDKRVKFYVGFETSSGVIDWLPQGVFLIDAPTASSTPDSAEARISGGDKWKTLDGAPLGKFADATIIQAVTAPLVSDVIRLIAGGVGETKFAFDSCTVAVPYDLTYQQGEARGKAIKELADLAVYDVYYDVNGFLRFTPKLADMTTAAPCWTYDAGDARTIYASSDKTLDVGEFFNKVVVRGKDVSAVAASTDPSDPLSTVNVGERICHYNNGADDPLITTFALAQARADYELQQRRRVIERQTIELLPNYLHEAGDVITIIEPETSTRDNYELLRFDIPLSGSQFMRAEAQRVRKVA
jgi:hypothetical protein